jgi:uncharacterized protein with HEPN domain
MSKAKYEFVLQMIEDIEYIIQTNGSITGALSHRVSKPAILMSLLQIGEALNKIETDNEELKKAQKGAYDVRNFIAHDYEGVNLALVEHIIRNLLQPLKEMVKEELR